MGTTVKLQTSLGTIVVEVNDEATPDTARNFIDYVNAGHYDNTVFHRVISNFMVQGGGFEAGMRQKATREPIKHEGEASSKAGLRNTRGTLAMARTGDPHSASSQFFINVVDNDFLDFKAPSGQGWGYCVFARVTEGMDVVDAIRAVKTGSKGFHQDVPVDDVLITKAEVV